MALPFLCMLRPVIEDICKDPYARFVGVSRNFCHQPFLKHCLGKLYR